MPRPQTDTNEAIANRYPRLTHLVRLTLIGTPDEAACTIRMHRAGIMAGPEACTHPPHYRTTTQAIRHAIQVRHAWRRTMQELAADDTTIKQHLTYTGFDAGKTVCGSPRNDRDRYIHAAYSNRYMLANPIQCPACLSTWRDALTDDEE